MPSLKGDQTRAPTLALPSPILQSTAADVITYHAKRDFGNSGFREVALTVFNRDETAFNYEIFHIWKVNEGTCSSLYFLTQPSVLCGTSVLLVERPYVSEMEIWLRLRTADKPIRVDSSRRDQLVLGTDFTYSDLRFWLPTDDFHVDGVKFKGNPEVQQCILSLRRKLTAVGSSRLQVTLDASHWLPLTMEWFEPEGSDPRRIYSVKSLVCCDGIWTPRAISVSRPRECYRSVMTLHRALHCAPVDDDVLQIDNLARFGRSTFDNWKSLAHQFVEA